MANRVRRARVVSPEKFVAGDDAEREWDLTNAPLVCDECLVCMRDKVPGAMLAVDISKDHTNVLAMNVSDVGIDDALTTGLWNAVAFPAGNFCVSCAFACAALGQHPMTRQSVAAVIPCVDLSIKSNRTLMHNSLCNVFYAGKSLPSTWLVFYGALDALKREQRFPDAMINAFQENILHHTNCNLFPDISPLGKTEPMLDAMRRAVCLPIDRVDPESWLVTLRNRSIPSVAMMTTTVVNHDPSDEARKAATCMMRRQFFKTIVTAILNAAKRKAANLKKMRRAIENDIFTSIADCPLLNTQRLVSITSSNLLKVLFNASNYNSMMSGMARVMSAFKMDNFDQLITPAAFSSFLAYIYEHVTRAEISASQRKVEDFLSQCFKPGSSVESHLLADAFFDGAVETSGGDKAALSVVLSTAPFKNSIESVRKNEACGHNFIPRFSKCHLYSPPVSHCAICGHPFVTQREISILKEDRAKSEFPAIVEKLKERRAKHFSEVFSTRPDNPVPDSNSCAVSLHESVRVVCSLPQFRDVKVPTRELVLAVLDHILDRRDPGCPYKADQMEHIVLCLCDYLEQRAKWTAVGRVPPGAVQMPLLQRLRLEIDAEDEPRVDIISESGLDPELFKQLCAPIQFDPAADNCAPSPKSMNDDDN